MKKKLDKKVFENFYDAWLYLFKHKMFENKHGVSVFMSCLDVEVVKVNPATNSVDDDISKNTKVRVWLEAGKYDEDCNWHDIDLDCGGDTFEEAIIALANLHYNKYSK